MAGGQGKGVCNPPYHRLFGNLSKSFYLFGKRKARKFRGTNQYKKEDINRKSFLQTVKLVAIYFTVLPIQICSFVQEMASLPIDITKCNCTLLKLECAKRGCDQQ